MHPAQTLDLKINLMVQTEMERWKEIANIQMAMDLMDASGAGGYSPASDLQQLSTSNQAFIEKRTKEITKRIVDEMHSNIQKAHCYYVAPQMTDLITWAAAGLDDTDSFRYDEVPTVRGFVYFENPIQITDIRGKTMLIHGVAWFPLSILSVLDPRDVSPGFGLVMFNDQVAQPDDITKELIEKGFTTAEFGRWGLTGIHTIVDGQSIGTAEMSLDPDSPKADELLKEGIQPHEYTNMLRVLHAYWLMLDQTVTTVSDAEIPRHFARRARRMEIPDRVTIVALRRLSGSSHGESDVDWQYRWIVRGHWRWQHVSKDHPLAEPDPEGGYRARVWVRAHVKGPEDKPLHVTEKVYSLVR